MRELKFRAWDGQSIRYDITGFEHGVKNEMDGVFIDGEYYSMRDESLTAALDGRHASVMQYTGLNCARVESERQTCRTPLLKPA